MDVSSSALQTIIDDTRLYLDEPAANAKYSDTQILRIMQSVWATLLADLNRTSTAPIIVRHSFTVSDGDEYVLLPPTVGQVLRIASYSAGNSYNQIQYDMTPRSLWNPAGPGFTIEGNVLRFTPKWQGNDMTFQLFYIPSGSVAYHSGTLAAAITNSTSTDTATLTLATSATLGSIDNRPNAYAGCLIRILSATTNNYVQERIIQSHDVAAKTVTVAPAFDSTLVPATAISYEIVPFLMDIFDNLIALAVCRHITAIEGDTNRLRTITQLYNEQMRANRLGASNLQSITGSKFSTDTIFNERNYTYTTY